MNSDKNLVDKKGSDLKKADAVETPPPPQHMDPSEIPETERADTKSTKSAKNKSKR